MSTNPPTYFTCSDGDTLGKGYSGGACSSNVSHHALIMKYEDDNIVFARVSPLFLNYIIGYVLILSLRLYKEKILGVLWCVSVPEKNGDRISSA